MLYFIYLLDAKVWRVATSFLVLVNTLGRLQTGMIKVGIGIIA